MDKKFLKLPSKKIDKMFFCMSLASAISGEAIDEDKVFQILEREGIELDNELKNRFMETFPHLEL